MTEDQSIEWDRLVEEAYRPIKADSYSGIEVHRDLIHSISVNLTNTEALQNEVIELRVKMHKIITQSAELHQTAMDAYNGIEGMKL